jgi:hypothetical protein
MLEVMDGNVCLINTWLVCTFIDFGDWASESSEFALDILWIALDEGTSIATDETQTVVASRWGCERSLIFLWNRSGLDGANRDVVVEDGGTFGFYPGGFEFFICMIDGCEGHFLLST